MAIKFTCDRCGSDNVQGNLALTIAMNKERSGSSSSPLFFGDICFSCISELRKVVSIWAKEKPETHGN